jgi:hypothetical protein
VGKAKFPLVGDPTHTLTRAFGVHIEEEGLALRGTFVINPEGVIKTAEVHSNEIARDISETLRKLKAYFDVGLWVGSLCPLRELPRKYGSGPKEIRFRQRPAVHPNFNRAGQDDSAPAPIVRRETTVLYLNSEPLNFLERGGELGALHQVT